MHCLLLTLVAVTGADAHAAGIVYENASLVGHGHHGHHGGGDPCQASGQGRRGENGRVGCFGNMPQSCYDPKYGCYGGNDRHMQRYPAFHGTYYRRPYNYRNLFDYPWHADLHEPTSLFSYNVPNEPTGGLPTPPAGSAARPGAPLPVRR